jgi:hypothetical protein
LNSWRLLRESSHGAVMRRDARRAAPARIEIGTLFGTIAEKVRASDRSSAIRFDMSAFGVEPDARCEAAACSIMRTV